MFFNYSRVLVLDELESYLDFKNQLMILKLIKKLVKEKGLTCIINTHYPEHALKISDKTLFLGTHEYIVEDTKELITEENVQKFLILMLKLYLLSMGVKVYKLLLLYDIDTELDFTNDTKYDTKYL